MEHGQNLDGNHHNNINVEQKILDDEHEGQKLITEENDTDLITNLTDQIDLMQDKFLRAIAESENTRHSMN